MSWVGGDITGLQAMGAAMASADDKTADITKTLDNRVDTLANDADWRGDAATAFRRVWSESAIEVGSLNATVSEAGTSISALGDDLAKLERALHDAADEYGAKGVPIGPNGQPQAVVVTGNPSASPAKDVLQAAKEYRELYDSTMMLATKARSDTANGLSDLLDEILPKDGQEPAEGVKPDVKATAADYVRGLLVIPNEKLGTVDKLQAELKDARQRFKDTRQPLKDAKAEYDAKGLKLPATSDAALAHSRALQELNAAADQFAKVSTPRGVLPGSDWLNVKLGDLATGSGALAKSLPEELSFLKDIPVLDIAATGFVGVTQGADDHDKGRGAVQSYASDLGAGAMGLGAGAAATAYLAGAEVTVPVTVAVAGVGITVWGVGNIAYEGFHEHWAEDIHDDGVLAGLGEGAWNSVSTGIVDTGTQASDVGKSTWHFTEDHAKSVWHDVFG